MIDAILKSPATSLVGRVLLTFVFWGAGIDHASNFQTTIAEMHAFGVEPAVPFGILAVVVLLGGSALVIADRVTWLGAGALATFTALTIPIAHRFWALSGDAQVMELRVAAEHISLIGGLMFVAIASTRRERAARMTATLKMA